MGAQELRVTWWVNVPIPQSGIRSSVLHFSALCLEIRPIFLAYHPPVTCADIQKTEFAALWPVSAPRQRPRAEAATAVILCCCSSHTRELWGPLSRARGPFSVLQSLGDRTQQVRALGGCAFSFLVLSKGVWPCQNPLPGGRAGRAGVPGVLTLRERSAKASRWTCWGGHGLKGREQRRSGSDARRAAPSSDREGAPPPSAAGRNLAALHPGCLGLWVRLRAGTVDSYMHTILWCGAWGFISKAASLLFSQSGPPTRLRNIIIFANVSVTRMEF